MSTYSFLKTWATPAAQKEPPATHPRTGVPTPVFDAAGASATLPDELVDWPLPAIALLQERLAIMEHDGGAVRPDSVERAMDDIRQQWIREPLSPDPWDALDAGTAPAGDGGSECDPNG